MLQRLHYRDGREGDVDPVLIERGGDGSLGIVVNYPRASRRKARNRFLLAASAAIAFVLMGVLGARSRSLLIGSLGLLWFIGAMGAVVFAILWVQSGWTYWKLPRRNCAWNAAAGSSHGVAALLVGARATCRWRGGSAAAGASHW